MIFVNCLRFSLKLLSRLSQKAIKYYFLMEKKTNKAKLEILKFWENRLNRNAIAFDKISRIGAFYGNSIIIHLLGYFCMQNSFLWWKQCKILRFSWKRKNIENHWFLLIVWDFHWNSWADCHENSKNIIFRW